MLRDITYTTLKQDKQAYEILLRRDQYGNAFADIAKEFGTSTTRAAQMYHRLKYKQMRLYINHIVIKLGDGSAGQARQIYNDVYACYQDWSYACAYLEKTYEDVLTAYREGEPGMPEQFIRSIPPFRTRLSKKTVARIVEMREVKKASFIAIAKELHMTRAKAKHTYEWFYHKQVLEWIKVLQDKAESREEKNAIWDYYFRDNRSVKKRYDELTKEHPNLLEKTK